jgi:hypothetical protein
MDMAKESATQFRITAVCTVTDPVERKRRLARVYDLIVGLNQPAKSLPRLTSALQPNLPNEEA